MKRGIDIADGLLIAHQASLWLGTPHRNGAMVRGVGVDCALLAYRCACDQGLLSKSIEDCGIRLHYQPDWFLHHDGHDMIDPIERLCIHVSMDDLQPGDILTYRIGRAVSHVLIVYDSSNHRGIHADARLGFVCYADYHDPYLLKRFYAAYRFQYEEG